jgi:hypothetical protein
MSLISVSSSISVLFGGIIVFIIYRYKINGVKIINNLNDKLLEQKREFEEINNICERLLLVKLNNYYDNLKFTDNYLNFIVIIQLFILWIISILLYGIVYPKIEGLFNQMYYNDNNYIILIIVLILSFIIISLLSLIFTDWLFFRSYINKIIKKINEIDDKIKNKREQINLISVIV